MFVGKSREGNNLSPSPPPTGNQWASKSEQLLAWIGRQLPDITSDMVNSNDNTTSHQPQIL